MAVEVRLFGFGDVRPGAFGDRDQARFELPTPVSPAELLARLGFRDTTGLVLMQEGALLPPPRWDEPVIHDGQRITLMWAIEGG